MANEVFANTREISCKKAAGKSICAFPDVCMTPPTTPATPMGVPIPYPNTGMAKDTANGTRTVKITGQEVMKRNVSYYKTSYGDEAGVATPAKKGIITGTIKGKVYFKSWSMDVKFESKNVVRHLDMTTHNHKSEIGNESIPWPHIDEMSLIHNNDSCDNERKKIKEECGDPIDPSKAACPDPTEIKKAKATHSKLPKDTPERKAAMKKVHDAHENYAIAISENPCTESLKCALVPYNANKKGKACCPHQTADHLVPASQFGANRGKNHPIYKARKAPCMCATGGAQTATHGLLGRGRTEYMKENNIPVNQYPKSWTVADSCKCGAASAAKVTSCSEACIEAQLRKGHEDMGINLDEPISTRKEIVKRDSIEFKGRLNSATASTKT